MHVAAALWADQRVELEHLRHAAGPGGVRSCRRLRYRQRPGRGQRQTLGAAGSSAILSHIAHCLLSSGWYMSHEFGEKRQRVEVAEGLLAGGGFVDAHHDALGRLEQLQAGVGHSGFLEIAADKLAPFGILGRNGVADIDAAFAKATAPWAA